MPADAPITPLSDWAAGERDAQIYLNASAVALGGKAALILGSGGAGKSTLALELMALGAELICDDAALAAEEGSDIVIRPPEGAPPLIEARGIGLLQAGPICAGAPLCVAVDLDTEEPERLPPQRRLAMGHATAELIYGRSHPRLAPALIHMLRHGRAVP